MRRHDPTKKREYNRKRKIEKAKARKKKNENCLASENRVDKLDDHPESEPSENESLPPFEDSISTRNSSVCGDDDDEVISMPESVPRKIILQASDPLLLRFKEYMFHKERASRIRGLRHF